MFKYIHVSKCNTAGSEGTDNCMHHFRGLRKGLLFRAQKDHLKNHVERRNLTQDNRYD